ncbi:sulfotransferase [Streptomyces sp. 7R007]
MTGDVGSTALAWEPSARPPMCLVLGTGRCGSTALSEILRGHPEVLSVSELFAGLRGRDLTERDMEGGEFWRLIATPHRADSALLRFKVAPEVLYPLFHPRDGANRFAWPAGLPPLAGVTLPHLTDRPDDLYEELEAGARALPRQPLSEHLWWLFAMLARDRQPSVVVERSGGSLGQAAALLRLFPQALVVHVYRDGRECALSMSRHARFRLSAIQADLTTAFGYDPYAEDGHGPGHTPVDGPLADLTPDRLTKDAFEGHEVPLSRYGLMWSAVVAEGLPVLSDASRLLEIDYRDLVDEPQKVIAAFHDFLQVGRDPAREARQAAQISRRVDARAELGADEWAELSQACRMGMNRLYGRGGWT